MNFCRDLKPGLHPGLRQTNQPVRLALFCWALGVAGSLARAAELKLPPIQGELAGDFKPLALAGEPQLHWTLALASPSDSERKATLTIDGAGSHLRAEVALNEAGEGTWRLVEGRIELKPWLNGQLTAGTATVAGEGTWRGGMLNGNLTLQMKEVDLGELAHFADPEKAYVHAAAGRVEGTVRLRLKDGTPSAGDSLLRLPAGTVATITFVPSPGLLTQYVPAQVLKLYPGIEAIEMGRTPLEAKVLRLAFRPDGDAQGRGARLRIEGRPLDPKIIAPLELEFNFTGPLESLIRKSLDSRLNLGGVK